jgi:hypothetical protein
MTKEQCVVKEHRDWSKHQDRVKENKPTLRIKQKISTIIHKAVFAVQYSAG